MSPSRSCLRTTVQGRSVLATARRRWAQSEEIGWVHSQEIRWVQFQEIGWAQSEEILHPGSVVSVQQPLEMIPQRLRQPQHRGDLRAPGRSRPVTLVHRARDLIEVPPEGSELLHGLPEKRVFHLWERRSAP